MPVVSVTANAPESRYDIHIASGLLASCAPLFAPYKGRKAAVGRPFLFGTTDEFLRKFQLEDLGHLPDYNEVLDRISILDKNFRDTARDGLYFEKELNVDQPDFIEVGGAVPEFSAKDIASIDAQSEPENNDDFDDMDEDFNDVPDFLKDEEYEEYK